MNNRFANTKIILFTAALFSAVSLSGCRNTSEEEAELAVFSSSIADFKDFIQEADMKINSLDVNKKESAEELLEILDDMDAEFAEFAERSKEQTPDKYESVPGLAQRASEDMSSAVSYYHTAYESETFDQNYADAAYQYYENSMMAVRCIGLLLMGEITEEDMPEDDRIAVYEITNDENILDKWLSGDKDEDSENMENETTSEEIPEAAN